MNRNIELEWQGYFRNLIRGVEGRAAMGEERKTVWEGEIEREEIIRVVRKLKDGKAMGTE